MAVPSAPTGVTIPAVILYGGGPFPVSWTFVGTGPQTAYGFRWREVGNPTWRGDLVEVPTATASGTFPPNHIANSTFPTTDIADWDSSAAFGAYTPARSWARTTAIAHTGTASLLATWPTAEVSWVNTHVDTPVLGLDYDVSVWCWVPFDSPDVALSVVFFALGPKVAVKDEWTKLTMTMTATTNGFYFPGVEVRNSRNGDQCFVDDMVWTERFNLGGYELQVRTKNADGWGPYSATKTFTVVAPVWRREDGEWVPRVRQVRVGGVWRTIQTKEI